MADGRVFQFQQISVDRYGKNVYGKYGCFVHCQKASDLSYAQSPILAVS